MVDKMATMLIRESSDLDDSTSDDDELDQVNGFDAQQHSKSIAKSNSIVDQRIVDLYKLKRWSEDRKHHKDAIHMLAVEKTVTPQSN